MRKDFKKIKKLLSILLIFLISINSFATSSDNTGSNFITKAEFDFMINEFQSKINDYQTTIDSTIDNAVSAYLAGVRGSIAGVNIANNLITACGGQIFFRNTTPDTGSSALKTEISLDAKRSLYWTEYSGFVKEDVEFMYPAGTTGVYQRRIYAGGSHTSSSNPLIIYTSGDTAPPGISSWVSVAWGPFKMQDAWIAEDARFTKTNVAKWGSTKKSAFGQASYFDAANNTSWKYHLNPDGSKGLSAYLTQIKLKQSINAEKHHYRDYRWSAAAYSSMAKATFWPEFKKIYLTKTNGKKIDDTSATLTITDNTTYNTIKNGTPISATSTTEGAVYYTHGISKEETDDGKLYQISQWGKNCNITVYAVADNQDIITESSYTTWTSPAMSFTTNYLSHIGDTIQTNSMSAISLKYHKSYLKPTLIDFCGFINTNISTAYGDSIYIGNGVPIYEASKNYSGRVRVTYDIEFYSDEGITPTTRQGYLQLSNKPFLKGTVATGATGTTGTHTFDCTVAAGETLWLNAYANTTGDNLVFTNFAFTELD